MQGGRVSSARFRESVFGSESQYAGFLPSFRRGVYNSVYPEVSLLLWLGVGLLLLLQLSVPACSLADDNLSFATRQIVSFSDYPTAWQQSGLAPDNACNFQSLTRIIHQQRNDNFRLKIEFELSSFYSSLEQNSNPSGGWLVAGRRSGFKAFKTDAWHSYNSKWRATSELERFEFAFTANNLDFQIGRQPVSFGTSHFVSLLDVLAPFNPGYLDSSYKPGVDALRIRKIAGQTGEMELIVAAARNSADSAVIGRYRNTFSGFDIEALAGRFWQRNFIGVGWEGEKRQVNCWGEAALFQRNNDKDPHLGGFSDHLAGSWIIGFEKSVGPRWRSGIACMHQDFGARKPDDILLAYGSRPFVQGWASLAASDYLILNSNRELGPLSNININAIISLVDNSTLWQPVWQMNTSDESDISVFAWLNSGKTPTAQIPAVQLRSEFAAFASGIGLIYRRFF